MEELVGLSVAQLTASALLAICILMILRGNLVPKSRVEEALKDRDYWREAHKVSEDARATTTKQLDVVLEVGTTVNRVMEAVEQVRKDRSP